MKRVIAYILIFICGMTYNCSAQADIHYSQFYETALLRNPALTGVFDKNYKVSAYYRSQWSSITSPYQTMQISGEYRLSMGHNSNDFLSLGLLGYNDIAGELEQKITGGYMSVNYNKSINTNNNSYLSVGFVGGALQYSFDPSKATFDNQFQAGVYDPTNPNMENIPEPRMNITDVGAGINYNFTAGNSQEATYMLGISGYHFSQPLFSYFKTFSYTQNIRWNLNAAMVRELNENVILQVHANYAQQGSYSEIIACALIGWRTFEAFSETSFEIYGGVGYRYQDAVVPIVKLRFKRASFGISYDVNTSKLQKASNSQGGLEITATLTGNYPPSRGAYRKTVCPRFN